VARSTHRALITLLALLLAGTAHAQSAFTIQGILSARGVDASGPPSWLEHGFGRLEAGGDRNTFFATANLGADWRPAPWLTLHASGLARHEPSRYAGRRGGLVDAYVELHNDQWQLRAGQFFLGTSRENVGPLWSSPYTISFSALNTWIGEEVRPVGVDLQWKPNFYVSGGATVFKDNDTMGALLAWRGWSIGNRLTVYNEVLPLPPLFSLPTGFPDQRSDGTVPFEHDLDKRYGYSGRVRFQLPERAMVQVTHVDNRGDRKEYRDEYAWQTRFDVIGAQAGLTSPTTFAAEYARGKTGMGAPPIFVNADFWTWYLLVSHKTGHERFSVRYDGFSTTDRDHAPLAETNTEHGRAWLFAWLHDVSENVRLGAEYVRVTGDRPAAAESGFSPVTDAHTVTVELRYRF
jgi:hypothetical protein